MTLYIEGTRFEDEFSLGPEDYEEISSDIVNEPEYDTFKKMGHIMFYAPSVKPVLKCYNPRAAVHMKVRFDGHFGFPGGCADTGETPEDAVNRELIEESGVNNNNLMVNADDLCAVHKSQSKNMLSFFYVKKISLLQLGHLEKSFVTHDGWGDEVLGTVRVPLYTMSDGFRGFPAFLTSPFVGNSKNQLILGLLRHEIMTKGEIKKAFESKTSDVTVASESTSSFTSGNASSVGSYLYQ